MAFLRLWIDETDLREWSAKLKKAGIVIEVKKGIEKKTSSELRQMGYTVGQLAHFRKNYEMEIIMNYRSTGNRRNNVVYNYTEMQRLGLSPSTRKKDKSQLSEL